MPLRYDCFMFFNELEILEIRLNELAKFIDTFVIAEAPWTFQGRPKPLYFDDNRRRFRPFLSRIRHIVVDDELATDDPWIRESHQRNSLRRGLHDAAPDSTVIVSDVDEIIRPVAIRHAERVGSFCLLRMPLYLYFLDWKGRRPWMKAYCAPWSFVNAMEDLSAPRMTEDFFLKQHGLEPERHIIANGGWHFSWLGGVPKMMQKLAAFSHTEPEVQRWCNENDLAKEIAERRFFYNQEALSTVPLGTLPDYVRAHARHYHSIGLLAEAPPVPSLLQRLAWLRFRTPGCTE